jgi:hypothetical protein
VITFTDETFGAWVSERYEDQAPEVIAQVGRWLARGDGAAVYENHDLSSAGVGEPRIVSFGSPAAQLETAEPPATLPDIGGAINWRFQLIGTYRR